MASELDDNEGDRKRLRVTPAAAKDAEPPTPKGEVTAEVARVVNLLQRLDKLHSKQMPHAEVQPPAPRGHGGLSSLSDRSVDRGGLRAVPASPVPFSPPPIPPVRASTDLQQVLKADVPPVSKGPLPSGGSRFDIGNALDIKSGHEVRGGIGPKLAVGSTLDSVLDSATGAEPTLAGPPQARTRRDEPPIMLIASVLIGLVALAGLGLYQFQRTVPVVARDQAASEVPAGSSPARADAAASLAMTNPVPATGEACAATLVGTDLGVLKLEMMQPARAGQTTAIAVDDLSYGAAFDAKGTLRFEAPMLAQSSVVRWDQPKGPPCEKAVLMPKGAGLLRVALVWPGDAALDLHVVEPNAWFGGPSGHISALNRNTNQKSGAGQLQAFGDSKAGGAKAHVYSLEAGRLAPGGILNAFVKPAAGAVRPAACLENARPAEELQVQYQVMILRTLAQSGEVQSETRSYAMGINPCGRSGAADDRGERIIVRN